MERLAKQRETLAIEGSSYDYLHFFRNRTMLPEECLFKSEWIRKYECREAMPGLDKSDPRNYLLLKHYVYGGEVLPDINAGVLHKRMIVSLADAKKHRRVSHVILVAGYDSEKDNIYLLRLEVGKFLYGDVLDLVYKMAGPMGLSEFYLSKNAAQSLKFYLDERNRRDKKQMLNVIELDSDDSESGQANRIDALQTLFKAKQFWCHPSFKEFFSEYETYPAGTLDVLDTFAQVPATLDNVRRRDTLEWVAAQNEAFRNRNVGAGGY
jgi:hypothetical protein